MVAKIETNISTFEGRITPELRSLAAVKVFARAFATEGTGNRLKFQEPGIDSLTQCAVFNSYSEKNSIPWRCREHTDLH